MLVTQAFAQRNSPKILRKIFSFFQIRREELESHLQCETRHHLELTCCKLNNIQDEVNEKTKKLTEKTKKLEEKLTSFQRKHQKEVSNLQNQHEAKVKALQNQLEERVYIQIGEINKENPKLEPESLLAGYKRLNQNNKIKKEINTDRWALFFCFAVVFVIVGVLLGLANRVNVVQSHFETKMEKVEKSFKEQVNNVQRKLEVKMDHAQKKFEEKLNGIQSQLEKKVGKVHNNFQNQLEQKVDDIQSHCETNIKKVEKLFKEQVNDVQSKLKVHMDEAQKKFEEKLNGIQSQLEKRVSEVHNNLQNQLEKKVDDVQKKKDSLNTEPYTFTWKIESFEYVLTQAKSGSKIEKESEPFYMNGYKLKLQLYPNGNGKGQNTHLSLYLTVIKGEHDAILAWPLQKKFTFTLIDQQEDPAERKNVIFEFTADPTHVETFARPITNENIGRGYQRFVSHEELRTRRFVVDDVILIQIQVRP